jgi:putative ABC transport system permease protein
MRNLARRKGRYALTALGTALGVAVLFGVLVSGSATSSALNQAAKAGAGRTDVYVNTVGTFDSALPPNTDKRVAALPQVHDVIASVGFRSSIDRTTRPTRPGIDVNRDIVWMAGVDPASFGIAHRFEVTKGRFFKPGAAEVALREQDAKRIDAQLGGSLVVATPAGKQTLTIVGLLNDVGSGFSNEATVFTSIAESRQLLGRPDAVSGLDVILQPGVNRTLWLQQHKNELGSSVVMSDAKKVDPGFANFIKSVNGALTLTSVIALFVGAFLIFLTFSLAVAERTRTYGTLRALGAVPKQIRRLVVTEAAVLGLGSSLIGLVLGFGVAFVVVGLTKTLLRISVPSLGFPLPAALFSIALAVGVSVAAAWSPGKRAASISPVQAMREGAAGLERKPRPWLGLSLLVVGVLLGFSKAPLSIRSLSALLVLLGAVFLVPSLLRSSAAFLGLATRRLSRGVGDIAVNHLVKERSRSAYTLALVMVVLAMILAVAASNVAMNQTLDKVLTRQAGGAVQAIAPGAFDDSVSGQLAAIPGVTQASPIRFGFTELLDRGSTRSIGLNVIDPATYFRVASFSWVDGDDASVSQALAAGGAVLLPDNVASSIGVRRGGTVSVRTSAGPVPFKLAGTYAVIGGGFGAVVGTHDLPQFGNGRPNGYLLGLKPGVSEDSVKASVLSQLGEKYHVIVNTPSSTKAAAHKQLRGFFSLAYAVLAIAALIGMLGLANTLVVSVLTRTREIGMLRSLGTLRRQVRVMVFVEAATLAVVAFVLALPLSLALAAGIIRGQRASLGFSIHFVFPWAVVLPLAIVTLVSAAVASLIPARRAGKLEVVAALRFD